MNIVPESAVAQAYLRHWQRIDDFNDVTEWRTRAHAQTT